MKKSTAAIIVVFVLAAAFFAFSYSILTTPCAQEDSYNCVWDGKTMGNGTGDSFVTLGNDTYFLQITLND